MQTSYGCEDPELRSDLLQFLWLKSQQLSQLLQADFSSLEFTTPGSHLRLHRVSAGEKELGVLSLSDAQATVAEAVDYPTEVHSAMRELGLQSWLA